MRKIEFEVPSEVFGDFTQKLAETGLDSKVLGRNEDNEIEIEVYYEKDDAGVIDELEEHLDELKTELSGDEDDEDDDN